MWAGMEADLIPTEPGSAGPVKSKSKRAKDPKVPVFVLRTSAIGHFVLQNAVLVLVSYQCSILGVAAIQFLGQHHVTVDVCPMRSCLA